VRAPVIQTRGLNFNHNPVLKMLFKGAAMTGIAHAKPNPLRKDYERMLEQGIRPNLAKLTVARKIAAIVLVMWKKEERYDPRKIHEIVTG
jgi:transposase